MVLGMKGKGDEIWISILVASLNDCYSTATVTTQAPNVDLQIVRTLLPGFYRVLIPKNHVTLFHEPD
jgi:hypothetical protein